MQYKFKVGDKVLVKSSNIDSFTKDGKCGQENEIGIISRIDLGYEYPYRIIGTSYKAPLWCTIKGLANTSHATNEKIVITVDGKTTLARLYKDGKVVKSAEARCCPEDTFDFKVGANLAYERLMDVHVVEEVLVPVEPPKPKYYSGKVVCVEAHTNSESFTAGKIYEFKNGKVCDEAGYRRPSGYYVTDLNDRYMKNWLYKFIPLVEE